MTLIQPLASADSDSPTRKRGRPRLVPHSEGRAPALSRELILDRAALLAKTEPLGEISMVGLARELGVAPALIHYYIGSRDDLISGVANRYFKERYARIQPLTGRWKEDLESEAMQTFAVGLEYGGVLRYMMQHNRFRLFQQISAGETDYGMLFLDRQAGIFHQAGFAPSKAAICYHLLAQYTMTSCFAEVSRQLPAFHEAYIRKQVQTRTTNEMPGAHYILDAFSTLDSATAFPTGLKLLIDSFDLMLLN